MKAEAQTRTEISSLLDELSPESLQLVEQFVRFVREQTRLGQPVRLVKRKTKQPPYLYPTVAVPASTLDGLIGIMPPVEGDALEDTESLYDGN